MLLAPKLPAIQGNPGRLQQVFLNLFLNAKDAMPGGGKLRIATMNGESVSVCVSDTGSGIAPEHIQRIYDPFFTTKTSPREGQARGTGLGLSVTYGIIQEHAGKDSRGKPSRRRDDFHFGFPAEQEGGPCLNCALNGSRLSNICELDKATCQECLRLEYV